MFLIFKKQAEISPFNPDKEVVLTVKVSMLSFLSNYSVVRALAKHERHLGSIQTHNLFTSLWATWEYKAGKGAFRTDPVSLGMA